MRAAYILNLFSCREDKSIDEIIRSFEVVEWQTRNSRRKLLQKKHTRYIEALEVAKMYKKLEIEHPELDRFDLVRLMETMETPVPVGEGELIL